MCLNHITKSNEALDFKKRVLDMFPNKNTKLKVALICSMLTSVTFADQTIVDKQKRSLAEELKQDAIELNKSLPNRKNPENVLERVIAEDESLIYMYKFPKYSSVEIEGDSIPSAPMIKGICSTGKSTLSSGATVEFRYHGNDNKIIKQIIVNKTICKNIAMKEKIK